DALDAPDEAGEVLRLGARQLLPGGAVVEQSPHLGIEHRLDLAEIPTRRRRGVDDEQAAELAAPYECPDVGRDLLAVDELLVEARILAVRQDVAEEPESIGHRVRELGHVPYLVHRSEEHTSALQSREK